MAGGSFTVTLVVTDDTGHTGTSTQTVDVASDAPKADFTFSPKAPGAGVNVNFNAGASIPAPGRTIVSYFWDFGGFVTSTLGNSHDCFPGGGLGSASHHHRQRRQDGQGDEDRDCEVTFA